jgi:hypothetical protein
MTIAAQINTYSNNGIEAQGPFEVANGKSYHQLETSARPVSLPRSEALLAKMSSARNTCSSINTTYSGFTAEAVTAFEFAVEIWESSLESVVPITVSAEIRNLTEAVIAVTEPNGFFTLSGAGIANTLYPKALAEQILGSEIGGPNSVDILVSIDDSVNFYYGLDANPGPGQIDFVTMVLHELGHGLGFIGFGVSDGTLGFIRDSSDNLPSIYDRFIENGQGTSILDFADPSTDLHSQLTGNNLFNNSPGASSANGGIKPKVHAPSTFDFFKSYDHWDSSIFPPNDPNSLMTETVAPEQANHNPGEVTLAFFEDMGWALCQTLSTNLFESSEFTILENPVDSELRIRFNDGVNGGDVDIVVHDLLGKTVYQNQHQIRNNELRISQLGNLKSGVYFLSLSEESSGLTGTVKFVKD